MILIDKYYSNINEKCINVNKTIFEKTWLFLF